MTRFLREIDNFFGSPIRDERRRPAPRSGVRAGGIGHTARGLPISPRDDTTL
jgi:hypothetical protein